MSTHPHTDRLIAELRGNLDAISTTAANAAEKCRAFKGNESTFAAWLTQHAANGYVLRRESAAAKTAHLHKATCPLIAGEEALASGKSPTVGCPTNRAALGYAMRNKWRVVKTCAECGSTA